MPENCKIYNTSTAEKKRKNRNRE